MQKPVINKFIGPDQSAPIWYSARRNREGLSQEVEPSAMVAGNQCQDHTVAQRQGELVVEIWLFGLLSTLSDERPLKLRVASDATPMDVVAVLEERFGSEILSHIKDPESGILPCCRIFVDGESFVDVHAPIAANRDAASIE